MKKYDPFKNQKVNNMPKMDLLQDIQIKKAKPQEQKYFLNDGGGLRLAICPDNKKIWEFRFTINGKRRATTFKSYPIVSLKNARLKRNEYLDLISIYVTAALKALGEITGAELEVDLVNKIFSEFCVGK